MLLEFCAKNYKSFKDEMVLSMMPAPRITGLDYSVFKSEINDKPIKGLCSAVIYGPNASGKTNIIGAMDTFKQIILRGNIRNAINNINVAAGNLELVPFFNQANESPVSFSITFIENEILFCYGISMLIGNFMDSNFERKITNETLSLNNDIVFERCEGNININFRKITKWINDGVKENDKAVNSIATSSLNVQELFLTNGFKTLVSQKLASTITSWFEEKFNVFYRANDMEVHLRAQKGEQKSIRTDPVITEAAKIFGISSNEIGYAYSNDDKPSQLVSIIKGKNSFALKADVIESFGTVRFINEFPIILSTMLNGGTLVVDEFDASIHPMALMSIINLFHNDDINIHHAQLIFNTHNPIFLNANLFRRDEIKFVEKNDETGGSELYQLSDFGTAGENSVRKGEDYLKNYFVNRYGAIKEIDFLPLFEKLMTSEKRGQNES